MAENEIFTLREIDYVTLIESTLCRLTQGSSLPGIRVRNCWRFRMRDIEARIEAQKAEVQRNGERR